VGTPLGANERLIGGRALKELIKINGLNIITNVFSMLFRQSGYRIAIDTHTTPFLNLRGC
jgi:hypothetical protein